jgi:hypothetical protein
VTTPEDEASHIPLAADALLEIIVKCQETYGLPDEDRVKWRDAPDNELYRAARERGAPLHRTLSLLFLHAELLTERGRASLDRDAMRQAVRTLVLTRLRLCKRRLEKPVEVLNPIVYRERTRLVRSVLADVGADLSRAFARISADHDIHRIDVVFDASGPLSLDLLVRLQDGVRCFPQQLFSEAYQDLLALLFFASVAKKASERGQARILILDDVLQSVDARIMHSFVDYLLDEFSDWQLIITVHDRLWREQLRDLFDAHRHEFVEHNIYSWIRAEGFNSRHRLPIT